MPTTDDLPDRLRNCQCNWVPYAEVYALMHEAAAEIERLRQRPAGQAGGAAGEREKTQPRRTPPPGQS